MMSGEFDKKMMFGNWRDYRLVSDGYVWSKKRLVIIAWALCLPTALLLTVSISAPVGAGLGVLVATILVLGPKIKNGTHAVLFAVAFGIGATILMFGDSRLFPHRWVVQDTLNIERYSGVLFTLAAVVLSPLAWTVARFMHRRLIFRSRFRCVQCQHDLLGHSGGQCPKCNHGISPEVMEISPYTLRQLEATARESNVHRRAKQRSIIIATIGATATGAFMCARPYQEPPPPPFDLVQEDPVDIALLWLPVLAATERDYHPGSGYTLSISPQGNDGLYGWPLQWMEVIDVKWSATKDGEPIPIDDAFIVQWVAEERKRLTNFCLAPVIYCFLRSSKLDTFPSSYHWRIDWLNFYVNVSLAAVFWYLPFIVTGVRRGLRLRIHSSRLGGIAMAPG